jgi:hypothetical protein
MKSSVYWLLLFSIRKKDSYHFKEYKALYFYLDICEIHVVLFEEGDKILKIFFCRPIMTTVRPNCLLRVAEIIVKNLCHK